MGFRSSEIVVDAYNFMLSTGDDIQHAMARETILFSAIFTEAFMNDLTAWLSSRRLQLVENQDNELIALADLLPQFEDDRLQIRLKYQLAFYILNRRRMPTGGEPFQSFSLLIDLRNKLVHAHTPIFDDSIAPGATSEQRKIMQKMLSVGAVDISDIEGSTDWTVAARSRQCPPWAFRSAVAITKEIIESIQREDLKDELKMSVFSGRYNQI